RAKAERALAENEMRLRAIFASALDPVITTNADGIVQAASDSVERCFGWHPRETFGKSIDRLFYEGFHREYQQDPDSPLPAEESGLLGHTREIVALRNDGSSFPCEISVSRVTLPGQAGTLFTTIIRDITERRRSEEQRRQLVELIEHSPDLIGLASIEGKALYVNRAGREMVGLGPAAEVKRTTLSDYILPEDRSEFSNSVLSRVISGGGYVEKEFRLRNFMTGEAIPAQGKLFLIKDSATGEPVALATVTSDIRSRKKAEADLRASEALFRQFVESLPLGIVVHCDGQIVYANLSAARLVGEARAEDLLGRAVIEFIHPEDHHRSRARIRAMLESGAAAPLAEITLLARDGRQFTAEMHTRLIDFEGQRAILGVFMDVTERRQMQARLLQADRLASVGLLAAGVAHEMNNPLSYVIANLDFVTEHLSRRKARDPESAEPPVDAASLEELEEILREARSGAERVKVIVKDLRTFSRTDEETGTPTDLHPVLESTVNMAFKAIRTEARIVKDYGKTPLVAGNEARLGQVFMNLLQNAAQALDSARPGGNEIRLSTRTDDSGRACIEISDTGQGIDEMTLPRVFDPFFTTKPVGLGTGLGLSICRNLLEALGGEISITSRPGEGTTVRVLLPAAEAVAPARSRPGEAPSGAPLPRSRVLVVDDDPALGASLKRGLAEFHDVDVVVGGDEAIALLRENPAFDVILCDVMMPGRSGGEVYETLRAEKPELAQRFVFMTGGAFTEKARLFLERVDNPVIEKPFDLAHIRTFLGTFARHRA
ncbi:MAG: PAS domain S-box protein, partial [Deltaproteobacteria bacterium]|nr:PAS domain S-box protein [Deltaproteobacteria bacterium]